MVKSVHRPAGVDPALVTVPGTMKEARKGAGQPGLFDRPSENYKIEEAVMFGLGDFQSRGLELANRKLAMDRLLGAFRRSFQKFGIGVPADAAIAECLTSIGAGVEEVPSYVAKHPYRITVPGPLARRSLEVFEKISGE